MIMMPYVRGFSKNPPCSDPTEAGLASSTPSDQQQRLEEGSCCLHPFQYASGSRTILGPSCRACQAQANARAVLLNGKSATPDAAVTTYVNMYGDDLPEEAVKAIRAATRMGNKELSRGACSHCS
jgi:hypothetical protein